MNRNIEPSDESSQQETIFFQGLSSKQMGAIRHCSNYQTKQPGDLLLQEGAEATAMYIILDGEVEVFRDAPGGKKVLGKLGAGDIFGDGAMFLGTNYLVSVRAVSATTVFEIYADPFQMSKTIGDSKATIRLLENMVHVLWNRITRMLRGRDMKGVLSRQLAPFHHTSSKVALNAIEESLPRKLLRQTRKTLKPSDYLYRQGDKADGFYYIHSGRLEIIVADSTRGNGELILGSISGSAIAGEIAFFSGHDYGVSVRALEETEYTHFSRRHYENMKKKEPERAANVIMAAARHAVEEAKDFLLSTSDERPS